MPRSIQWGLILGGVTLTGLAIAYAIAIALAVWRHGGAAGKVAVSSALFAALILALVGLPRPARNVAPVPRGPACQACGHEEVVRPWWPRSVARCGFPFDLALGADCLCADPYHDGRRPTLHPHPCRTAGDSEVGSH